MIGDIWAVMWKEWKEALLQRGSLRSGSRGVLLFVAVFGIFLPWQMGRGWVESPTVLAYWSWVPLFLVNNVIADAFAGERERHTLETLLASRLSDRAILFGKIGAGVGYGWGLTMLSMVLGLVTVNLAHGQGRLLFFPPTIFVGILVLSLLIAWLAAGAGVLISLRASTVRQAQQTLGIAVMLLLFLPVFGFQALPAEWKARFAATVMSTDLILVALIAAGVLVIIDLALVAAAMVRFRRSRLILS